MPRRSTHRTCEARLTESRTSRVRPYKILGVVACNIVTSRSNFRKIARTRYDARRNDFAYRVLLFDAKLRRFQKPTRARRSERIVDQVCTVSYGKRFPRTRPIVARARFPHRRPCGAQPSNSATIVTDNHRATGSKIGLKQNRSLIHTRCASSRC